MKKECKTIRDLIIEYFKRYPHKDLSHGPVVDWVEEQTIREETERYLAKYKKIISGRNVAES